MAPGIAACTAIPSRWKSRSPASPTPPRDSSRTSRKSRRCVEGRNALDHRLLNEIEGLARPSLENLCLWISRARAPRFANLARVTVQRDSSGQGCSYTGHYQGIRN